MSVTVYLQLIWGQSSEVVCQMGLETTCGVCSRSISSGKETISSTACIIGPSCGDIKNLALDSQVNVFRWIRSIVLSQLLLNKGRSFSLFSIGRRNEIVQGHCQLKIKAPEAKLECNATRARSMARRRRYFTGIQWL